jgi:hypothetical protein
VPGDLAAYIGLAEGDRGVLDHMQRAQPAEQHVLRQEVVLDKSPDADPNAVLALGDDRGMGDGQAERVTKQRGDREPIRQRADHSRLGEGADEAHPEVAPFQEQRTHEDYRGPDQQPGGGQLHTVQLGLACRVGAGLHTM